MEHKREGESLPPVAGVSNAALQPRASSVASSRSRSGTPPSAAGSRAGSEALPEPVPSTSEAAGQGDGPSRPRPAPLKRERSISPERMLMAQSSQWDEDDGPPSLKRMRLQTDSIDDVNRYLTRTASSSFDANYANLFGSHGPDDAVSMAQASTLGSGSGLSSSALAGVAGPSTQPYTVESIDVDALPDDTAPVAGPSGTSEAGISLGEAEDAEDEVKTPEKPKYEPLSAYICPICFSPPTNATLTPCGHICCGECLFNAVKATLERGRQHGPAFQNAKCPVCRATIPGWDGQGGGVIGLKPRFVYGIGSTKS